MQNSNCPLAEAYSLLTDVLSSGGLESKSRQQIADAANELANTHVSVTSARLAHRRIMTVLARPRLNGNTKSHLGSSAALIRSYLQSRGSFMGWLKSLMPVLALLWKVLFRG